MFLAHKSVNAIKILNLPGFPTLQPQVRCPVCILQAVFVFILSRGHNQYQIDTAAWEVPAELEEDLAVQC